ncbi:MAG TPA: mycothiol system anti-sigma-R factor [Acidimicrobiia bacterium]|jgi:mycothiol system anti-sigma-R factor
MSRACNHAVAYVYQYIDEEMTWSRRLRIRWHLNRCGGCADAFTFEQRVKRMIKDRCQDDPPEELFDRLRTLIREEAAGDPGAP